MRSDANAGMSGENQEGRESSVSSKHVSSEDSSHLSLDQLAADQARAGWLAAQAVRPLPEIRSERIAALQSAIADGSYQVSAEQIAEAILTEHQVRAEAAA